MDDLYGVHGTHHDSQITVVELASDEGDEGSHIYVRTSRFEPTEGAPWPARIEVDADIAEARRWSGEHSVWLNGDETTALTKALTLATIRADGVNLADRSAHPPEQQPTIEDA